jgi:hypothetical protein
VVVPILATEVNSTPRKERNDVFPVHQDLSRSRHLISERLQKRVLPSPGIKIEGLRLAGFGGKYDRTEREAGMVVTDLPIEAVGAISASHAPCVVVWAKQLREEVGL